AWSTAGAEPAPPRAAALADALRLGPAETLRTAGRLRVELALEKVELVERAGRVEVLHAQPARREGERGELGDAYRVSVRNVEESEVQVAVLRVTNRGAYMLDTGALASGASRVTRHFVLEN